MAVLPGVDRVGSVTRVDGAGGGGGTRSGREPGPVLTPPPRRHDGVQVEIYSSSYAAAAYLESIDFPKDKKIYVIGEQGIVVRRGGGGDVPLPGTA